MRYPRPRPATASAGRRGTLIAFVLALHVGLFALLPASKTVVPQWSEQPLMVDFIEPPKVAAPELKPAKTAAAEAIAQPRTVTVAPPKPVEKPRPMVRERRERRAQKPAAPLQKAITPPLESTASSAPAPANAPIESSNESSIEASREPTIAPTAVASAPAPLAPPQNSARAASSESTGTGPLLDARFDADYLENPSPPYPPQSRRIGEEGEVVLSVLVSADGLAQAVSIKTSSGSSRLDEAALRTVRQWRFIPATRAGQAIESRVLVPILFKLEQ